MASTTLVAIRFIAYMAHFVAALLFLLSRRDNLVVALKLDYTADEYNAADASAIGACFLYMLAFVVQAIAFFGGFTIFSTPLSLWHTACHIAGGVLLSLVVILKSHYAYVWYIWAFFSAFPMTLDIYSMVEVLLLRKRKW